jgi:glycosyltransferase involved in cell wall biosynthesis
MPTTVVVDASHLGGASAQRGIGTYLRAVLPRLARDLDVVGLATAGVALPPGVQPRRIGRVAPGRFAQREHDLRLPFDLARAARAAQADVVFSPADDPPRRSPRPWVQMLHDVIPLVVDDPAFAAGARRWRAVGPRLAHASFVCTNSQRTADDAVRALGIAPDRLRVIPLGVDERFRPPPGPRSRAGTPYVLYVGQYGPHKGFAEAFAVAAGLRDAGLPHRLTMVGLLAPWYRPIVDDLLAASGARDRVDLVGYVDDVVATYQQADALIVTSRYEGFCLPALEAMACGTPVVAFANSAIPEVVTGGGVLVPDGDVDACSGALTALLTDVEAWQAASEAAAAHARTFSWDRCANELRDVLVAAAAAGQS